MFVYAPYLDEKNTESLINEDAVKFIIWEIDKWNGATGGIDKRYLLNSDGTYLKELFNRYKIIEENEQVILLQKSTTRKLKKATIIEESIYKWNEWINVPAIQSGILRAKLDSRKGFFRAMKSALYKEEGVL
jgi:hypothetical protein